MTESPLYDSFRGVSLALAAGLIALTFVESAVRHLAFAKPVKKSTITVNLGMWLVELVLRTATGGWRWLVFAGAATLAPWKLVMTPWGWVLLYGVVDLFYYARHRLLHSTTLGWALHAPHHASTDLSLTSSLRLGWVQRVFDDFFYLPLVLLGVPPLAVFIAVELNHGSQLWCHTEIIGRLPWLDRFLNTPSNHRVHHARDRALADSNYAATFMLWDKLFGTYRAEPEEPLPLGWEEPYEGVNPFVIQFRALHRLITTPGLSEPVDREATEAGGPRRCAAPGHSSSPAPAPRPLRH